MTVFWVVIVPGILTAVFLIAVWVLVARCLFAWIRARHTEETAARIPESILNMQAIVIQDTIYELEANKLSYTGFPVELKNRLIDTHDAWANPSRERKGIYR